MSGLDPAAPPTSQPDGVIEPRFLDDVRAVAADLGVPETAIAPVPTQGQVNLTVFLGDELVLRLPRRERAEALLAEEAVVIPLVRAAGVPTPAVIRYDPSRRLASTPYLVLERAHGVTLAAADRAPGRDTTHPRSVRSLGTVLATLHRIRRDATAPEVATAIPEPHAFSSTELLDELVAAGEIGAAQRGWLDDRFVRLAPEGPSLADPVLVHRDVSPSNVIVDADGSVRALLDWGSAEWGSAARELVGLPLRDLPALLSGYRSALGTAGGSTPGSLARDALQFHLYLALARLLKRPSTSEDRHWAAPRTATLVDVLAFVSGDDWVRLVEPSGSD